MTDDGHQVMAKAHIAFKIVVKTGPYSVNVNVKNTFKRKITLA
jgi:hypothetical protein